MLDDLYGHPHIKHINQLDHIQTHSIIGDYNNNLYYNPYDTHELLKHYNLKRKRSLYYIGKFHENEYSYCIRGALLNMMLKVVYQHLNR